ncbi:MAG: YIP1 family protein [Desulfobacteraceae bacterium]|nr:YIP1 family protein [Desulfobacteraceae bacterium]
MDQKTIAADPKVFLNSMKETVGKIIVDPAGFFREMPKSGGYADPLIFALTMGVAAGIITALATIVGLGGHSSFAGAASSIILTPIVTGVFTFICAGVLFAIWKVMGSQESYEVSFRCAAYALAISPITAVLNLIPYIGVIAGLAWTAYILVAASTEIHGIRPKPAWIVFGAIGALLALSSISMQMSARSFEKKMNAFSNKVGEMEKMDPEEAGKAMGQFLKGMEKGMQK